MQEKTPRQARKDFKQGRQEKIPRQARKDCKAGKKRLQGRQEKTARQQEKTARQARKDSEAVKKRLHGRQETHLHLWGYYLSLDMQASRVSTATARRICGLIGPVVKSNSSAKISHFPLHFELHARTNNNKSLRIKYLFSTVYRCVKCTYFAPKNNLFRYFSKFSPLISQTTFTVLLILPKIAKTKFHEFSLILWLVS